MLAIERQLRIISLILLIGLLATGVLFGIAYLFLRHNYEVLSDKKQATKITISGEIRKEGLLMERPTNNDGQPKTGRAVLFHIRLQTSRPVLVSRRRRP